MGGRSKPQVALGIRPSKIIEITLPDPLDALRPPL